MLVQEKCHWGPGTAEMGHVKRKTPTGYEKLMKRFWVLIRFSVLNRDILCCLFDRMD